MTSNKIVFSLASFVVLLALAFVALCMVGKEKAAVAAALPAGKRVNLPHGEGAMIPGGGYYLLARDKDGSGINFFHEKDEENIASKQTPAQLLYNVRGSGDLPNLASFFADNGTIDLVAYDGSAAGAAYISEIMWGTDASQAPSTLSQWIEIANGGTSAIAIGENKWALWFYAPNETPPAWYTGGVLLDRVGTINDKGGYWSLVGKGQSGRTGIKARTADVVAIAPTQPLISMYRVMDAIKGGPADGTLASSWMASTPPSVNFNPNALGIRIGSPGADRIITAAEAAATAAAEKAKTDAAAAAAAKAADKSVSVPKVGRIYISEVMFAGGGSLPQWIEISNGSRTEQVNLSGWTLTVENAKADADVSVGAKVVFTIPEGTRIDPSGQNDTPSTLLIVTELGRNNIDEGPKGAGQILNLWTAQQTELILLGVMKRRYSLLSDMAFQITLAPPTSKAVTPPATETPTAKATRFVAEAAAANARKAATDVVGNLGADGAATWALPMDEGARNSILRRHVPVSFGPAKPKAGEMEDSWVLASDTGFAQATHILAKSYYGAQSDVGTPGFRSGGVLPVELSQFRPERQKDTGAVVITWSTQSELNNAGFFIKRSQQRDGEFKVINATMIPGAGTTSEKQFYIYTDTTAQPDVVYYYQITDVSLDGNCQTLSRGIRLKGHIGAAGKLTTTWGELKTSR